MQYRFSERMSTMKPSAIREILKNTTRGDVIPLAAGNPSPEAFPTTAIAEITADILTNNPIAALQYGISEGYAPLRAWLKRYLREEKGMGTDADELLILTGAQQGMELAAKALRDAGDVVICEDPSFIGSLNAFRSHGLRMVGVPVRDDGMDMDALEAALQREGRARFIYTIPNFQNPAGVTMSLEKRRKLYALALQYGVLILEDNPYGDLRYFGADIPTIKSLDSDGIVLYVGSFSKTISPGLRVGFLLLPAGALGPFTVAKQAVDVHTPVLNQMIVNEFVQRYGYAEHLARLREIYRRKLALALDCMETHLRGKLEYVAPEGGLFIYCKLPEGVSTPEFCARCIAGGVAVVPGTAFSAKEGEDSPYIRINFSTPTDAQLVRGIEILGSLL